MESSHCKPAEQGWHCRESAHTCSRVRWQVGSDAVECRYLPVPELDAGREFCRGTQAREIARTHLVLVGVEERQRTGKLLRWVRCGPVHHLSGEIVVVAAIVEGACGKPIGMTLQGVNLLDLAAVGQTDILDAEVVLCIVSVGSELSPMR